MLFDHPTLGAIAGFLSAIDPDGPAADLRTTAGLSLDYREDARLRSGERDQPLVIFGAACFEFAGLLSSECSLRSLLARSHATGSCVPAMRWATQT